MTATGAAASESADDAARAAGLLRRAGLVEPPQHPGALRLVIAGTSDLHGYVRGWDYYTDTADATVGLARVATLMTAVRAHYGRQRVLLLDAGDTVQGSPLTWYAATGDLPGEHPMAAAMRPLGYTAAALGNHDVEYGFDLLDRFVADVDFPVLAANTSGSAALPGSVIVDRRVDGFPPVRVGIVGLTNPGIGIWTKDVVAGRLHVGDIVTAATDEVARLRADGVDAMVAAVHAGTCPFSSYGDALPMLENAAVQVAEQVPQIAAVLAGHAHVDVGEIRVMRPGCQPAEAVVTEPGCYGQRLSLIHLDLVHDRGGWQVAGTHAQTLDTSVAAEDPAVVAAIETAHARTRAMLAEVVGSTDGPLDLHDACWQANPALELVAQVAGEAASAHLPTVPADGGRPPLVAVVSPLRRRTRLEAGPVRARDLAALYRFDNKLVAIEVCGAQLRDYLEWSARYFRRAEPDVEPGVGDRQADWPERSWDWPEQLLRNPVPDAPAGLPDYDYDVAIGVDGVLTYDIDCARPVGDRVRQLRFDGVEVEPGDRFVLVVTGYRANGSRNYPHVAHAPVRWRSRRFVRAMLHDHLRAVGQVRTAELVRPGWRLTVHGVPVAGTVAATSQAVP